MRALHFNKFASRNRKRIHRSMENLRAGEQMGGWISP
jgi:hypothetical protein